MTLSGQLVLAAEKAIREAPITVPENFHDEARAAVVAVLRTLGNHEWSCHYDCGELEDLADQIGSQP